MCFYGTLADIEHFPDLFITSTSGDVIRFGEKSQKMWTPQESDAPEKSVYATCR